MYTSWRSDWLEILSNIHASKYCTIMYNWHNTVADVNDVHTTKSRTQVIYSLKELAHFSPRLLVDFLHLQYIDFYALLAP